MTSLFSVAWRADLGRRLLYHRHWRNARMPDCKYIVYIVVRYCVGLHVCDRLANSLQREGLPFLARLDNDRPFTPWPGKVNAHVKPLLHYNSLRCSIAQRFGIQGLR